MLNYYSWWVGEKKTKLRLYSTIVEILVEIGVELGNTLREGVTKGRGLFEIYPDFT